VTAENARLNARDEARRGDEALAAARRMLDRAVAFIDACGRLLSGEPAAGA